MQSYIEGLAKGTFSYDSPRIIMDTDCVEFSMGVDSVHKGSFLINVSDDRRAEGFVYSGDHRMVCVTREFSGNSVQVSYEFNSFGLQPGSELCGRFIIVSTAGELELPYKVTVKAGSEGEDSESLDLAAFVKKASEDWYGAYEIFSSDRFSRLLMEENPGMLSCYRALCADGMSMQCMEEFLTGFGQKDRVDFEFSNNGEIFHNVNESFNHTVKIKKSEWGYIRLAITTDSDFIIIQKNVLTTEDFVGSTCDMMFFVEASKLHYGINYGRIKVRSASDTKEYIFKVIKGQGGEGGLKLRSIKDLEVGHNICECIEKYSLFMLGRINEAEWAKETADKLAFLTTEFPENKWFALSKALGFIYTGRTEEALAIIEDFKTGSAPEDNSGLWAFYLYMMTLIEKEEYIADRIKNEFNDLFRKNKESLIMNLISPYMNTIPEGPIEVYDRYKSCFEKGYNSPLLYAACAVVLNENPLIFGNPDDTDICIMQWMARKDCISPETGHVFMEQLSSFKKFSPVAFRIGEYVCRSYDTPDNVRLFCGYLIRMDMTTPECNKWYLKGIEYDLKVTRLYEYYISSMDDSADITLPKVIYMYFKYNSNIDNRKKAFLFAKLIENKRAYPEVYDYYRDAMVSFANDQFLKGVINDNMAVIYTEFFDERMIMDNTGDQFIDIASAFKLETENTDVTQVSVVYNKLRIESTYAVNDGTACIMLYSNDYDLIFSDGNVRFMSQAYSITPFVDFGLFLKRALRLYRSNERVIVKYMEDAGNMDLSPADQLEMMFTLLHSDKVKDHYKTLIKSDIIDYYYNNDSDYESSRLLEITFKDLPVSRKVEMADVLIKQGYYEHAYKLIRGFGYEDISTKNLLKLATYIIEKYNYEPSLFLDHLCKDVFDKGMYNQQSIRYLKDNHEGSIDDLSKICSACEAFGMDVYGLYERMIKQMLYTDHFLPETDEIYDKYYRMGATNTVNRAYLQFHSYCYLIKEREVSGRVFELLLRELMSGDHIHDVCKLALLKHWALSERDDRCRESVSKLLTEFFYRGYNFSSFEMLERIYDLDIIPKGRVVIEYITNPERKVEIHYIFGTEDYVDQEMLNAFEGIFVKEFTMFYGEEIKYYITELIDGNEQVVESGTYRRKDLTESKSRNSFDIMNEILMCVDNHDDLKTAALMKEFGDKKYLSEKLFTVI